MSRRLIILSSVSGFPVDDGRISISQTFLDGVRQYQRHWPGAITVLMEKSPEPYGYFDETTVQPTDLPFELKLVSFDRVDFSRYREDRAIVLAGLEDRQEQVSRACRAAGVACIYWSEYSLRTRKQIIASSTPNPLRRIRGYLREHGQERKFRQAVALADGLQCNGTPTYDAYARINRAPMLFFDSRATASTIATDDDVEQRTRDRSDRPLRLLYAGRLIAMKGADHLVRVAQELRRLQQRFELLICGDGSLRQTIADAIARAELSDCVTLAGVLDYRTELVPLMQQKVDLFVCCHPQGDPSRIYLEAMACGVPIVGYANEAFEGIVRRSGAGWVVPLGKPRVMAHRIAQINQSAEQLRSMSLLSLRFARENTFENTFKLRTAHMAQIARAAGPS